VLYSNEVHLRNNFGQFIAACDAAATATVEQSISEGAALSKGFAPKRTGALSASIKEQMLSAKSGRWFTPLKYAHPQEFGGDPHLQTGWVTFLWEEQGRMWEPGENMINHPGNAAQPFMRPAYSIISRRMMAIAKSLYPG